MKPAITTLTAILLIAPLGTTAPSVEVSTTVDQVLASSTPAPHFEVSVGAGFEASPGEVAPTGGALTG